MCLEGKPRGVDADLQLACDLINGLKKNSARSAQFQIVIPDLRHTHLAEAEVFLDHVGFSLA